MGVYYNEHDPKAAEWLRELIKAGHIAEGEVDERSIADVQPADLVGFTQCHFFAGIGGWSYALRLAGWPDNRPVWTGSCPCQPFSAAGKGLGTSDPRHLWPEFFRLIAACDPAAVFGEQVASKAGRIWLAGVRTDLETLGRRVAAADLCAAGFGSPHIRQRLFWVAFAGLESARRSDSGPGQSAVANGGRASGESGRSGDIERLADMQQSGLERHAGHVDNGHESGRKQSDAVGSTATSGATGERMGNADVPEQEFGEHGFRAQGRASDGTSRIAKRSPWSGSLLIPCGDGKFRRVPADEAGDVKPSLFPLAHGVPGRVGLLRGAGNAIVPIAAAEFIQAAEEARCEK